MVPSNFHLIVTTMVVTGNAPFPASCEADIYDKTVGKDASLFQRLFFTNFSNSLAIPFTPGMAIAGSAEPALIGGCNGQSFNNPAFNLHGYLTAN